MNRLDKVLQYRQAMDTAQQEIARAAGKLDNLMDELQRNFKCNSRESGKDLQKSLTTEAARLDQLAQAKLYAFEKKWGHVLEP